MIDVREAVCLLRGDRKKDCAQTAAWAAAAVERLTDQDQQRMSVGAYQSRELDGVMTLH